MSTRNSLSPNAVTRRDGVAPSLVARLLDRISRLEASLNGTRLEINHVLDGELEELRAIRKELLAARGEQSWSSKQTGSAEGSSLGKIVEFPPTSLSDASASTSGFTQAELSPMLEVASIEDLSVALAAVFKERRTK